MAGPAGWQGWRPQLLHGPGRGRCAASRVRSVRSRRVGSGSGVRSARPLEPPALQSGQSRWQPQGWRSRVLIARNARGCEGYRADPRQSSFGTLGTLLLSTFLLCILFQAQQPCPLDMAGSPYGDFAFARHNLPVSSNGFLFCFKSLFRCYLFRKFSSASLFL